MDTVSYSSARSSGKLFLPELTRISCDETELLPLLLAHGLIRTSSNEFSPQHEEEEEEEEEEEYDPHADNDNVSLEVTTCEGVTLKFVLPPEATVLQVKKEVEQKQGIKSRDARLFANNAVVCILSPQGPEFSFLRPREEELEDSEELRGLRSAKGAKVEMAVLVEQEDAQAVVPGLAAEADLVLGNHHNHLTDDSRFNYPAGIAFVPSHPDWLATTEYHNHRIKITNIRTGETICKWPKLGTDGGIKGQLKHPGGIALTSDSTCVVVADTSGHRVLVLRLVVGADGSSAHLVFVRFIGEVMCALCLDALTAESDVIKLPPCGHEYHRACMVPLVNSSLRKVCPQCRHPLPADAALLPGRQRMDSELSPIGIAMLPDAGGQETVLVTEAGNNRVLQFALDGTLIRIFAGTGQGGGSGDDAHPFYGPRAISVLGDSSGDVAVVDQGNHRVQIFDSEGNYKRQFGSEGTCDGLFYYPAGITSDAHGNLLVTDYTSRLQVFSPKGKHLCTRGDLSPLRDGYGEHKAIAWSAGGDIAIASFSSEDSLLVWHNHAGLTDITQHHTAILHTAQAAAVSKAFHTTAAQESLLLQGSGCAYQTRPTS
jgi:hypothetical protein